MQATVLSRAPRGCVTSGDGASPDVGWSGEKMGLQSVVKLGLVAAAVAIASPMASAAPIYDSGGFESPKFTAGAPLAGQDVLSGPWLKDPGTSTATISTVNAFTGTQDVVVTRVAGGGGDTRWAVTKPQAPAPGFNVFDIDTDVRVEQANFSGLPPTNADFGPAFGLEAYDASTTPLTPKLIGSLTIDATTGDVLYQATGTGVLTETGTVVTRGAYHHLKLRVDFGTGKYSTFVDNNLLRTESFVNTGIVAFTDAPISTFAASGTSVNTGTGTAYFDNYAINVIPEPTGAALIGLALAGFAGRRRRQVVSVA